MVCANIPNIDENTPINVAAGLPPAQQIVWDGNVGRVGYDDANTVIYSLVLDSTIGDFDFNWYGLVGENNVLVAAVNIAKVLKRKYINAQIGNNVVRNLMVKFTDAANLSAITVPAESWQLDFIQQANDLSQGFVVQATAIANNSLRQLQQQDQLNAQLEQNRVLTNALNYLSRDVNGVNLL